MRKVILLMGMSLDGIAAAGWIPPVAEAHAPELYEDIWQRLSSVDTFLFGRVTYEIWKEVWPPLAGNPSSSPFVKEFALLTDRITKIVFSRTLQSVDWNNSSLVTQDISNAITQMKEEPGKSMAIVGGAGIARSFAALDLIDDYHLYVHPRILVSGKPLLAGASHPRELQLIKATGFKSGVVGLHLQRQASLMVGG